MTMEMPFGSFGDFWEPHLRGVAPQGLYVAGLSAEHREALRQALKRRLLGDGADGGFTLHARALVVRGTVPFHKSTV
jgi:hypothetical protein